MPIAKLKEINWKLYANEWNGKNEQDNQAPAGSLPFHCHFDSFWLLSVKKKIAFREILIKKHIVNNTVLKIVISIDENGKLYNFKKKRYNFQFEYAIVSNWKTLNCDTYRCERRIQFVFCMHIAYLR